MQNTKVNNIIPTAIIICFFLKNTNNDDIIQSY